MHSLSSGRMLRPSGSRLPAPITNSCRAITPRRSEQRRDLPDLHRPKQHRAVSEAQREGARLLALESGLAADGIERDREADIGVLLDDLAEARNGPVEGAEEIVDILRLHAGRDAVKRRLGNALLQDLVDAERRHDALEARDRHLQFAIEIAVGIERERARGYRDHL